VIEANPRGDERHAHAIARRSCPDAWRQYPKFLAPAVNVIALLDGQNPGKYRGSDPLQTPHLAQIKFA
jgi:hypothetical protein